MPVWPIWPAYGYQPASTTARVAATRAAERRRPASSAELEALGLAEAAAAGDEDVGVLDVDVGAALLAALDHRRLASSRSESSTSTSSTVGRAAAGLGDLERVQAADDDPDGRRGSATSEIAESPRIGRSATSLPSSTLTAVTSIVTPASRRAARPAPISKPSRPPPNSA